MARFTRRRPGLLLAVAIGLATLLVAETAVLAVTTIQTGGTVRGVKVVTETAQRTITWGSSGRSVKGMSLSMTVPSSGEELLLITFSSAAFCHDGVKLTAFWRSARLGRSGSRPCRTR